MLAIDTLKLAEDLKKGGFNDKQTQSLVNLGRELSDQALENLATKDDLEAAIGGLRKDMTSLEERMDGKFDGLRMEMKALEQRMVIKLGSMIVVGVGFLVLLDRLLPAVGG